MKKILTIIAASLALASGLLLSSCSDDDDEFFGPSNTWCELPITQTMEDGTEKTIGYIAAVYCDELYTSNGTGSKQLTKGEQLEAGITVVVWGSGDVSDDTISGSILKGLSKSTYIKKTFSKTSETKVSNETDSDETVSFQGKKSMWKLAYFFKLHTADTKEKLPEAPVPLLSSSNYSDASNVLKDFSWKTVLKQYLIKSL